MITTLSESFLTRTYPISGINYIRFTIAEFNGDLRRDGPGGCGPGWNALLDLLRNLRAASRVLPGEVFLGLLPRGVPIGSNIIGCGDRADQVAAAFVDDPFTAAHEIGHAFGRKHAPCCDDPSDVDANYPQYGTYPTGSIGEFGFGTTFSTVLDPTTTFDFMTYCPPESKWISPYTYRPLFYAISGLPAVTPFTDVAASAATQEEASVEHEYLHLNFRMYRGAGVELLPSFHLSGVGPTAASEFGPQSPVVFELRDAGGQVIGFHRCHLSDPSADPASPYHTYHEVAPWDCETRSIAFLRDGEEVEAIELRGRGNRTRRTGARNNDAAGCRARSR